MSSSSRMSKLLDVPIHRLMEELSRKEAESLALIDSLPGRTGIEPASSSAMPTRDLWTDRYKPTRFTDLIGDERVHRETLAWVKQWDFCVFGPQKVIGKNKGKKRARDEWSPNAGSSNQDQDWEESKDEWKRPKEKLLLLSGPPGLGKTTLAHVVAQQAGYSVFEINASDARSGSIIDDRIKPALEAGAAVGKSKPYLVVIDEIDGATGAGDNAGSFVQKL
ncbi:P-loop containing nucleoside triphosphate hydrolase protein, partial [Punctularia strigosozonata HHB-11173 SS5]|uniref:P-loop containing nucleoside triphosphate hydrolase protein n=1 Tax=Punctularia strigosozonata (strain HHB-11173) TaxID=741275 RepID=UPI0004416535